MSFSFFKPSRPKTPQEVVKATKDSLMALDTKTVVEVKALEKALEEVEKNFLTMRCMLSGDGEVEPNMDQVSQLATEVCKEDVLTLLIHKLPILGWEVSKKGLSPLLVHIVEAKGNGCPPIPGHSMFWPSVYVVDVFNLELLWEMRIFKLSYDNKEVALNSGIMLRECIKFPSLAKYIIESASFQLFFKFVELPVFDISSDAFCTFKDLLTRHGSLVSEYLTAHYDEFFDLYEKLLTSCNYVTRRQSLKLLLEFLLEPPNSHIMKRYILEVRYLKVMMTLLKVCAFASVSDKISPLFASWKDSSKNIQISAFHIFKVFVANPNKPREVKVILAKNHEKLLELLRNLSAGKGADDDQFEEEKELIIKEIERVSGLPNLDQ
ncbi:hypothetical protein Pint_24964 [Pistacia integerrima]|uniref:Uncharacterized protein n=1 Tax=Pistacia integerrima TaxID=434235 RepID=A0ACC0YD04_9ROSI|nr:hypothetical protein Pint_24964 [Pistacia integerrima]